ncbi:MAG: 3-alpha domain-containing protein [Phycisphaerae bacterium]
MKLISVNKGRPRIVVSAGRRYSTAIFKTPIQGPLELTPTGLLGDHQANRDVHGGPDKAKRLRDLPELSDSWRDQIAKRLDDS